MNVRPILFSSPMVRALLDDGKTQTRRIIKPQPEIEQGFEEPPGWCLNWKNCADGFAPDELARLCPYGKSGDLLYVRETIRADHDTADTVGRIDLVQRTVTVQACYAKNGETKTVPMTEELHTMFRRRWEDRDQTPGDLVFVSRYNKPWKSWSTAWENACDRAGLEDFRFHDLRHCFGSWLAMNGTAPKAMMELMGHKTASMTMRYAHLSVEYKRQAVAKLPTFGNLEAESAQNPPKREEARVVGFRK